MSKFFPAIFSFTDTFSIIRTAKKVYFLLLKVYARPQETLIFMQMKKNVVRCHVSESLFKTALRNEQERGRTKNLIILQKK